MFLIQYNDEEPENLFWVESLRGAKTSAGMERRKRPEITRVTITERRTKKVVATWKDGKWR